MSRLPSYEWADATCTLHVSNATPQPTYGGASITLDLDDLLDLQEVVDKAVRHAPGAALRAFTGDQEPTYRMCGACHRLRTDTALTVVGLRCVLCREVSA